MYIVFKKTTEDITGTNIEVNTRVLKAVILSSNLDEVYQILKVNNIQFDYDSIFYCENYNGDKKLYIPEYVLSGLS